MMTLERVAGGDRGPAGAAAEWTVGRADTGRHRREYPKLYGGFLHPDSHGVNLYFTMTQYDQYNVSMMHATLPANAVNSPPVP
jgi:hypothetical protein